LPVNQISLRERKKHETREKLIQAAVTLAVQHGAAKVRVEDIAAAANVSPRTFSNYFPSKEAAMLDIALQIGKRISHSISVVSPELTADAAVRAAIIAEFPDIARRDWLSQVILMYNDPDLLRERRRIDSQIEIMAATAIAARQGMDETIEIYPRLVAATMIATVHVAIQHWLNTETEEGFRETLTQVLDRVSIAHC
jgi:AcrR family transcriptional regulator